MLKFFESDDVQISALIISDYSVNYSHWNATKSLSDWLIENKVPGIFDIDTRALTKILREKGSMLGKIIIENKDVEYYNPNKENLVDIVSVKEKIRYGTGEYKILLIDCGVKNNIIRVLLSKDTTVIRVPWNYNYLNEEFDGLFISNGPGDPKMCDVTIKNLKKSFEKDIPIMGICLGTQLMVLATGADTYKLKYGHRSHNQPVIMKDTNKCFVTSQNHGYAIDNKTINPEWDIYFTNLNDNTCEGIKHKTKPFFASQFHPEASSGPVDTEFLFDEFIELIKLSKQ